ncbi:MULTISPECIES: RelA/SpoT family protein [Faecalibacterium]|jgi:guanosine-3',5'-bis(diphosphate) 3'-pyrophosphohydrolase|uniref:GTP diphosphokinase n=2 Tax=Faecalibacterium TaxID=216851 RepID=A0A2A7ARF3_9FIRM|nr:MULTISPECIES: bifunctional (p)ppGpp synthetase/guanosine-3',5'-bis(diphosphate) 3'-pyrophosphohydrolase [Faecalibacterium]PDX81653.1 (p)ppGpp synthetase [Faecalibacterium prausnitzii]RAW62596.1 bifunctional (p)ppGpp synthetase/guanosine-3',5'-bis(diphosphate) 3'-pyrophosphohydrolase [Faecalibacterium hattorii]
MPEGKSMLDPVKPEDSYSAKTHLHQPVPEMATVAATALPADAPEAALPSEVRPEIITWEKLVEAIHASGKAYNMEMIEKAYDLANEAHKGVCRRSGEPYICHPLAVARLVLDLGMDTESIAAALLHDVVEDTPTTLDDLKAAFGEEVALLVDGVTKLTKIQFSNIEELQAENLRKMLLAMSRDVRVMIIKLCDRLHNMRTGDAWPEQKRRDKARETMEVYAPIANRLGILNVKEELEDRSLHYLDPVGYNEISKMLSERAGEEFLAGVSGVIERRLEESGIEGATIKRRVKSIYGIYRKTIMQNKSFDEIYDIYAVRIILDTLAECYSTLGLIHDMYHPLPNRFKDYISTPKPNGYQSLHTTVIGHEGIPFEVQIRTRKMDEQAEYGVAAHWKYKEGLDGHDKLDERLAWVSQLLENQRVSEDSGNLLHDLKSDLLPEEVFAFTPKGDVINLPAGATCIDFAYAIHSAVGNRMVGCKVNNRMVPIDHIVSTGEIIEVILGSADKGPSRDWLKIVRTSEAKSKIRNWFKKMRREENIQQGRDALARELRREMIFIPDDELDEFISSCCRRLRQNNAEELYAAIGYGGITIANCLPKLKEEWQKRKSEEDKSEQLAKVDLSRVHATDGVVVEGFDNTPIKFAKCCSPLPGDPIVGFITRGFGVSIHKQSCVNAIASMKDPSNAPRWVKAYWADSVKDSYKAGLEIVALDRNELLRDVLSALADIRVPIYTMNARQVENNCAVVSLTIGINNTEHLNRVVARLSKIKDVLKVTRS